MWEPVRPGHSECEHKCLLVHINVQIVVFSFTRELRGKSSASRLEVLKLFARGLLHPEFTLSACGDVA